MNDLKELLDYWSNEINVESFVEEDPVQFPRRFTNKRDIEIAAILTSVISWGKRSMILNSCNRLFSKIGVSPYDYVMSSSFETLGDKNVHRTFFEPDLKILCRGLKHCYENFDSLEDLFIQGGGKDINLWSSINFFRSVMSETNDGVCSKHISDPLKGSACKRMFLALRWLIRKDGIVDIGIWKNISPSSLYIPLDVHVGNTSRSLGFLTRKANDKKSVDIITKRLREFCPEDPIKYDFALFGIGQQGIVI